VRLATVGLSYAQAGVLVRLFGAPAATMSQSEMIEALAVSRASGTLLLGQLEARGLIVRTPDPGDARRLMVMLTESGRQVEQPVRQVFHDVEMLIRRSLRPGEVEAWFDVLSRMFETARRLRESGGADT
jgi:MarR family transcriptional regulator, organic hydroperoxide resistance regulator